MMQSRELREAPQCGPDATRRLLMPAPFLPQRLPSLHGVQLPPGLAETGPVHCDLSVPLQHVGIRTLLIDSRVED